MKVLVVGAGTMGHGIAEVCALSGHEVTLVDISDEILERAKNKIKWSLEKLWEKGKMRESPERILDRIKTTTNLEEAAKYAEFVIEAVIENTEVKRKVFKTIDENNEVAILSTNTSTIPITEIASATSRPSRVIGLHFFNPPALIKLVEIIRGEKTSDETVKACIDFAKSIGMDYVLVNKDVPGFLVNRINLRVFGEALALLEEGKKAEEIDAAMRYRLGLPMGLFEVVDFSGVDVIYNVMREVSKRGLKVIGFELIEEMVKEGRLGMKTGKGFYEYTGFYSRAKISRLNAYKVNPLRILAPGVNEAAWIIRNNVASKENIDKAMVLGMSYPRGILEVADDYGIDNIVYLLESRKEIYTIDPLLKDMLNSGKLGKKSGEGFYKWKHESLRIGLVNYEKRHNYVLITMERIEKLNALNEEMWKSLHEAFIRASKDPDVRVVMITGKGNAFSVGADISVMNAWRKFIDGIIYFEKVALPVVEILLSYEKPIISLVNGYAFGGGLELNLFFDIVIASEDATFSVPEGLIGAMPPIASTLGVAILGRKLGRYLLTGEQIDAEEAKALGLVDVVVPRDQLEIAGIEFVEKISKVAPLSCKAIKASMNSLRNVFAGAFREGMHQMLELSQTEDFREGMEAFLKRRKPIWKGE